MKNYSRLALRATLLYCLIAVLWILFSDRLVSSLISDPLWAAYLQTYKGMAFVLITALLFYFILRDQLQRWETEGAGRRQAEAALIRVAAIIESSNDAIISKSLDGIITSWNPTAEKLFGYPAAEIIGQPMFKLIPADRIKEEEEILELMVRGESVQHFETGRLRKDGRRVNVSVTISPITDVAGRIVGVSNIARDITEEKQKEESFKLFRALIEKSNDAIEVLDPVTGRFLDVNERGCLDLGYSREEFLALRVFDVDPQVSPAVFAKAVGDLRQQGDLMWQGIHRRKDGSTFPVEASLKYVRLDRDYLVSVVRDVTERRQVVEALLESEARYRTVMESATDAIITANDAGKIVGWNLSAERLFGYSEAEVFGRSIDLIMPPRFRDGHASGLKRVVEGGDPHVIGKTVELEGLRKDGGEFPLELSMARWESAGGQFFTGIIRDITERKRAEEAHARLATVVDQAVESIVITDTQGKVIYVNPAFEKVTGYTRAEALGQNPRILKSGRQNAAFYRQMWEVLKRGEVWHGHFSNRRKDGVVYEEEASISPVRDAAGTIVSYVAVKRDVTREVELEAQFRQTQKMEAIGQLASGVAHDFNNILAVIQLQAGLLKSEENLSAKQLELTGEIEKATGRAANLTRQLLLFSRKQALQPRDIDLNEVVANISKMLQRMLGEDVQMQFKLSPQPLLVHADAGMLDQVLMNLAVNARDAMPQGGQIVIETSAREFDVNTVAQTSQARPGSFVCVCVSDTGCGIPPEVLPKIFDPFFTTKDVGKGSGLGLATVFGIVQQHQGWVDVYSEVGLGTTIRFYLPRLAGEGGKTAAWSSLASVVGGKETVLLVEDDLCLRASIQTALLRLGYHVLKAASGGEALAIWKEHHHEIHLLLTDMVMPGLSGKELAEQLLQENPQLKVIYASGYSADTAGKGLVLQEGVNFLSKPFEAHKLAIIVRNRLDKA